MSVGSPCLTSPSMQQSHEAMGHLERSRSLYYYLTLNLKHAMDGVPLQRILQATQAQIQAGLTGVEWSRALMTPGLS